MTVAAPEPTAALRAASACPLDCPDTCSLEVTIENGRVTKLDGSHTNPVTDGYICTKVRRFPQHLYGRDRLLTPLQRVGAKGEGRFAPISWEKALDLVADRLAEVRRRAGGEAILPLSYGGSNGLLTQGTTDHRLFWRLGASELLHTVCAAPTGAAATGLYGKMPGVAYEDFPLAQLVVVWGVNPWASGIHQVPLIQAARRNGARLVVVDPRRTQLAKQADLHLAVRPGTDLPVALSLIHWFFANGHADLTFLARHATGVDELGRRAAAWSFERAAAEAGVEAADLLRLAELYRDASPALLRTGWGLERNRNGGSAVAAVLALPAVAGKFGVRAGGYTLSNSGAWKFDSRAAAQAEPPRVRAINMNQVGAALAGEVPPTADGRHTPIELLFVYNCNPLATLPNQEAVRRGLAREDLFTVVFEQVATDTVAWADVVLPATTFLEHHELRRGYGAYVLQQSRPAIPPVGEARANYRVFADLCQRLGLDQPGDVSDPETLADALLEATGQGARLREELARDGIARPSCGPRPVQFVDCFPRTADGKIHLCPPHLDREAPLGLYGYAPDPRTAATPLALVSPATSQTISSSLGQLRREQVPLEMHPEDAAARGLVDGARIRVWNALGEVHCRLRITPDLARGVVCLPKGLWSHNTDNGNTANALAPDTLTDLAGGACFNDARVEVAALGEEAGARA
jgi:anaerobic selenocysteine-containing dehydrogenase